MCPEPERDREVQARTSRCGPFRISRGGDHECSTEVDVPKRTGFDHFRADGGGVPGGVALGEAGAAALDPRLLRGPCPALPQSAPRSTVAERPADGTRAADVPPLVRTTRPR